MPKTTHPQIPEFIPEDLPDKSTPEDYVGLEIASDILYRDRLKWNSEESYPKDLILAHSFIQLHIARRKHGRQV